MRILTLFSGHEASACLLEDGVVKNYYKEERYSKKKHAEGTKHIFNKILTELSDIDYALFSTQLSQKDERKQRDIILSLIHI